MAQEKDKAAADASGDPTSVDLVDDTVEPDADESEPDDADLTEAEKVAKAAAKDRPVRKQDAVVEGKGHATAKQRKHVPGEEHRRATPVQFVRESVAELKKVVWPTLSQLQQYFIVVLVFVLIMIGIVALLDVAFGTAILKIFG